MIAFLMVFGYLTSEKSHKLNSLPLIDYSVFSESMGDEVRSAWGIKTRIDY